MLFFIHNHLPQAPLLPLGEITKRAKKIYRVDFFRFPGIFISFSWALQQDPHQAFIALREKSDQFLFYY